MWCDVLLPLIYLKMWKNFIYRHSCRLPDLRSREVVFRLRISPPIWSPNQNGSKCSVRNLCRPDFCKNPRKFASLPCPFKLPSQLKRWCPILLLCRVLYSAPSSQRYWNRRYNISIWTTESNVFFKYFKYSWVQKEVPVSGLQQRQSMVIVYKSQSCT